MQTGKQPGGPVKPTKEEQARLNELNWVRVYLLDELIAHNGEQLTPDKVGDITFNVVEKLKERL